ncbi:hypothetical protein QJS66_14650 [Kocuria rhizophila]|nr:hypothetical protein QJS66_14650 [Kocuria rhizophila]
MLKDKGLLRSTPGGRLDPRPSPQRHSSPLFQQQFTVRPLRGHPPGPQPLRPGSSSRPRSSRPSTPCSSSCSALAFAGAWTKLGRASPAPRLSSASPCC